LLDEGVDGLKRDAGRLKQKLEELEVLVAAGCRRRPDSINAGDL
jgi:hypothetical protein